VPVAQPREGDVREIIFKYLVVCTRERAGDDFEVKGMSREAAAFLRHAMSLLGTVHFRSQAMLVHAAAADLSVAVATLPPAPAAAGAALGAGLPPGMPLLFPPRDYDLADIAFAGLGDWHAECAV
jgi:hypothetical protein